ncbi:MAG TPA: hypothetical protein VF836_10950 [Gemmatimonadaceae bacterium]
MRRTSTFGCGFAAMVEGGAQLDGYDDNGARVVAIASGPVTVSVRFSRATGAATLVVLSPLP